jgi:hypothetical protein
VTPRSIKRLINVQGFIGDGPAPARSELPLGFLAGEPLSGSPEWWAGMIAGLAEDGFDTIVFWPVDRSPHQVEVLANDVVPLLSSDD